MVSRHDEKFVLWPAYFDIEEPRPWRRVPKDLAVYNPTAEQIARVAADLRLSPVLEKGRAHPARWYKRNGRVLIDIRGSKQVLMRQIAERLKARQQQQQAPAKKSA